MRVALEVVAELERERGGNAGGPRMSTREVREAEGHRAAEAVGLMASSAERPALTKPLTVDEVREELAGRRETAARAHPTSARIFASARSAKHSRRRRIGAGGTWRRSCSRP